MQRVFGFERLTAEIRLADFIGGRQLCAGTRQGDAAGLQNVGTVCLPETDIVVLPELFSTAFTISAPELAESNDGLTMQTVSKWAKN